MEPTTGAASLALMDYEVLSTYSLKVKITGKEADEKIAIVTVRIKNVLENTIGLNANQVFYSQGKSSGVDIGTIATSASINTVDQFTILEGNTDGLFFVSPSGIIYLLKKAPTARDYDLKIEIKASDAAPVVGSIQIRISNTNPLIINNNFEFNILKEKRDINGNYLVLDINVDKINFTLGSIRLFSSINSKTFSLDFGLFTCK
jgi:hypothetical protein